MITPAQRLLGGLAPPLLAIHLAFAGMAPLEELAPPPAGGGGGGGGGGVFASQRSKPANRQFALQIVAPQQVEQVAALAQPSEHAAKPAGTNPAARQGAPQTQPAGAPITPQATPVPTRPESALLARSDKASDQISATATTADQAASDQDAADRQKDRQRRIAIALALLMLDA